MEGWDGAAAPRGKGAGGEVAEKTAQLVGRALEVSGRRRRAALACAPKLGRGRGALEVRGGAAEATSEQGTAGGVEAGGT